MAQPLVAGLPPDCHLSAGYIVRLTALNPTTGAAVANVALSDISFLVTNVGAGGTTGGTNGAGTSEDAFPLLVPLEDWF